MLLARRQLLLRTQVASRYRRARLAFLGSAVWGMGVRWIGQAEAKLAEKK
uniref:Uncharacterized protein n=1 Tax=Arundo donax TaxID=35708 RepID=A0A0A9ERJ7_ARUDO